MDSLKSEQNIILTQKVLKSLAQNHIITVLDFLQEEPEKISTLTKLSLTDILNLRKDILKKYSSPLVSATNFIQGTKQCLSTGIQALDEILDGGIPIGFITELCGLAETGKSQLCFQLAINCAKHSNGSVLYIDTKGEFSALRIQKILDCNAYTNEEMAELMQKIKVLHIWTMDELIEFMKLLKNNPTDLIENLRLVIIDSLPCLMLQYLGNETKIGLSNLNVLVNYSRYLSKTLKLGIVCVNIQTRWIDQDVSDNDDDEKQSTSKENLSIEKKNRCLGLYWQHIPALVLQLERKCKNDYMDYSLLVGVIKSHNNLINKQCTLKIGPWGVT